MSKKKIKQNMKQQTKNQTEDFLQKYRNYENVQASPKVDDFEFDTNLDAVVINAAEKLQKVEYLTESKRVRDMVLPTQRLKMDQTQIENLD